MFINSILVKEINKKLIFRTDLNFIGNENAAKSYGGKLNAWSFLNISGEKWFMDFESHVLSCIGKKYLPVYRLADGEYRFLLGRKFNKYRKNIIKEVFAFLFEFLRLRNTANWKTSWGETYDKNEYQDLKSKLILDLKNISENGYLACYLNDNGLNAFVEYNYYILRFFEQNKIKFDATNYIPFHFVVNLLVSRNRHLFFIEKNILIVSSLSELEKSNAKSNLLKLGVKSVQFIEISKYHSLKDTLSLFNLTVHPDICFVAAGIGSANIINQLSKLNTVVLDIGGFINCICDIERTVHAGIFKLKIDEKEYWK